MITIIKILVLYQSQNWMGFYLQMHMKLIFFKYTCSFLISCSGKHYKLVSRRGLLFIPKSETCQRCITALTLTRNYPAVWQDGIQKQQLIHIFCDHFASEGIQLLCEEQGQVLPLRKWGSCNMLIIFLNQTRFKCLRLTEGLTSVCNIYACHSKTMSALQYVICWDNKWFQNTGSFWHGPKEKNS